MRKEGYIGITGAANGIGRELSKQFISKGYSVVGIDIDKTGLVSLEQEGTGLFTSIQCDMANKTLLNTTLKKLIHEQGVPLIWINNAGIAHINTMKDTSQTELETTMQVNFFALVTCVRFWLKHMEKIGGGTIVNIGSVAGYISSPGLSAYVSSKFAVTGFTESVQVELELSKSSVNLILASPGFVDTSMLQTNMTSGFPTKLLFLATTVEACARQIVDGVFAGQKTILPTANGKLLLAIKRLSPNLAKKFSKVVVGTRVFSRKKF